MAIAAMEPFNVPQMVPQAFTPPPPNLNMFLGMVPHVTAALAMFALLALLYTMGHQVASAQPETK